MFRTWYRLWLKMVQWIKRKLLWRTIWQPQSSKYIHLILWFVMQIRWFCHIIGSLFVLATPVNSWQTFLYGLRAVLFLLIREENPFRSQHWLTEKPFHFSHLHSNADLSPNLRSSWLWNLDSEVEIPAWSGSQSLEPLQPGKWLMWQWNCGVGWAWREEGAMVRTLCLDHCDHPQKNPASECVWIQAFSKERRLDYISISSWPPVFFPLVSEKFM